MYACRPPTARAASDTRTEERPTKTVLTAHAESQAARLGPESMRALHRAWQQAPPMAPAVRAHWWTNIRMRWNCHSTAIEGSRLSYKDTVDLLLSHQVTRPQSEVDLNWVRGHDDALHRLREMADANEALTASNLQDVHRLILGGRPYPAVDRYGRRLPFNVRLGAYKTRPNVIPDAAAGVLVEFAPPEAVPRLIDLFVQRYMERLRMHMQDPPAFDPAQLWADAHWDFINIHPFEDGNGRMARWIVNYLAVQVGYPPLIITMPQRTDYFDALRGGPPNAPEPALDNPYAPLPPMTYAIGVPAIPSLRDFMAEQMVHALEFGIAVAEGRCDPTVANSAGDPHKPPLPTNGGRMIDMRAPALRVQDRNAFDPYADDVWTP